MCTVQQLQNVREKLMELKGELDTSAVTVSTLNSVQQLTDNWTNHQQ
jgi:hypothetical protein